MRPLLTHDISFKRRTRQEQREGWELTIWYYFYPAIPEGTYSPPEPASVEIVNVTHQGCRTPFKLSSDEEEMIREKLITYNEESNRGR